MLNDEHEILVKLKHDWVIDSVEQHTTGYWDFLDKSVDLRLLKEEGDLDPSELYEIYLKVDIDRILINISGDTSYYEVEKLNSTQLHLACYFQDMENRYDLVKLMTLKLSRK